MSHRDTSVTQKQNKTFPHRFVEQKHPADSLSRVTENLKYALTCFYTLGLFLETCIRQSLSYLRRDRRPYDPVIKRMQRHNFYTYTAPNNLFLNYTGFMFLTKHWVIITHVKVRCNLKLTIRRQKVYKNPRIMRILSSIAYPRSTLGNIF